MRDRFHHLWWALVGFAREQPRAFAFLELHHHASYLDEESRRVENNLKDFAASFVQHAQKLGMLKPLDARLLMELTFGAFIGMMRAHWDGRAELSPAQRDLAEAACWDIIALHK